jgi:hypothetical protein
MKRNKLYSNDPDYFHTCLGLISASLARNTWKRYCSALKLWEKFLEGSNTDFDFLNVESWDKKFLIWGWENRGLRINTLKIYLAELKELGRLARSLENVGQDLGKTLIQGMSNLATPEKEYRDPTHPLTVADLARIRKGLEDFKEELTGQSVWTCCVVAFWGAFRLGELLGNDSWKFDKFSSLLWDDVEISSDTAKIRIKSAKVRGSPGNLVYLFEIPEKSLCPITALSRLKKSELNFGMGTGESPVFRITEGKLLTKRVFLQIVNASAGKGGPTITGKSFRSALPSALENFPGIFRDSHVKALGRWRGRSYQNYMKNDKPEFRWVFETVSSALLKQNLHQENQMGGPTTWTESWSFPRGRLPWKRSPALTKKLTVSRQKRIKKQRKD